MCWTAPLAFASKKSAAAEKAKVDGVGLTGTAGGAPNPQKNTSGGAEGEAAQSTTSHSDGDGDSSDGSEATAAEVGRLSDARGAVRRRIARRLDPTRSNNGQSPRVAAAELERIARAADFAATQFRDWSFFIGPSATHFFKVAEEKTIAKRNGVKWTQSDVVAQAAKKAVDLAHAAIQVRQVLFFLTRLPVQ